MLVAVDQPASIGALPLAVTRDTGCRVAYLPGLTMRRIADLYAGEAKTDARDAAVICVVLGCGIGELLVPEPQKVFRPGQKAEPAAAVAGTTAPAVVPRRRDGRCLRSCGRFVPP